MAGDTLNTVITKVTIKGEEQKFVELELHQKFNAHHTFTVIVNYLSPKNTFQQDPNKFIQEEFYKLKYCSTVVYMVPRA